MSDNMTSKPWTCWRCTQLNSSWATECGRCGQPMRKPVNELNVVVNELRDAAVKLVEALRSIPAVRRSPAMEQMLRELTRAVDEYDKQTLYDAAKTITLDAGMPWTDPRTLETHQPDAAEYRCAKCGETFTKGLPDEAASTELRETFPGFKEEDCVLVCDDCYARFVKPKLGE
jgi:PHP family Zn ribbon phosphoesterase